MADKIENKKLKELQVFSGIAITFVVLIHSLAYYLTNILKLSSYTDASFSVRLLQNIIYSAVPMFIFIGGYKYALNNIDDPYKLHVIKKIKSVIKPFLAVSLLILIKNILTNPQAYASIKSIIVIILKIFVGKNAAYQLWYIPMYLFISLTYPLIYKAFKKDKMRIAVIVFIVLTQRLLALKFDLLDTQAAKFVYYYLFYEMGLMFCKYNIKEKLKSYDIAIIVLCMISTLALSLITNPVVHKQIQLYLLCPLSITAFYFVSIRLKGNKLLSYLGKNSFFIYLFHEPIVLTYISAKLQSGGLYNSKIYIFIIAIMAILVSIIIYMIIISTFLKYIFFNNKKKKSKVISF